MFLLLAFWWLPVFFLHTNEKWRKRVGSALFIVNLPLYYFLVAPAFHNQPRLTGQLGQWVSWLGLVVLVYGIIVSVATVPLKIKAGGPGYDPHQLLTCGVFGLVRHPQMAGALAISLGCACYWQAIYHLWLNLIYFAILYWQIWMEEKHLLLPHFGDQYHQYRKQVKALVPFIF